MKSSSASLMLDRAAIGLSLLCMVHCLALPLFLVLIPSLAGLPLGDEHFHLWLVFLVLPTSAWALFLGYRRHQRRSALVWGLGGVGVLLLAALLGHDLLGETAEKTMTVIGAMLVTVGHGLNFRNCRKHEDAREMQQESAGPSAQTRF